MEYVGGSGAVERGRVGRRSGGKRGSGRDRALSVEKQSCGVQVSGACSPSAWVIVFQRQDIHGKVMPRGTGSGANWFFPSPLTLRVLFVHSTRASRSKCTIGSLTTPVRSSHSNPSVQSCWNTSFLFKTSTSAAQTPPPAPQPSTPRSKHTSAAVPRGPSLRSCAATCPSASRPPPCLHRSYLGRRPRG